MSEYSLICGRVGIPQHAAELENYRRHDGTTVKEDFVPDKLQCS